MNTARVHLLLGAGVVFILSVLCAPVAWANSRVGGIGARVTMQDGWLTILEVLEDTPASRADFKPGFRIAAIDGQSVRDVILQEALRKLIGPPGEKVTLTVVMGQGDAAERRDVTLTRAALGRSAGRGRDALQESIISYKKTGQVQWRDNKIVSRVLPYPGFVSLFIRLPIAHAAATGRGVKIAVVQQAADKSVASLVRQIAPDAEISTVTAEAQESVPQLQRRIAETGCRVAVVPDPDAWPDERLTELARALLAEKTVVVVASDLSEDAEKIPTINRLHAMGAVTVGRLDRQSMLIKERRREGGRPFNRQIRGITTDVLSTIGLGANADDRMPTASVAGVAALVLERWPDLAPSEVRRRIVDGARHVWQGTSVETGQWHGNVTVDPITTEYKPIDEKAIFRFRVLDAASALGVDTEIPWFLNMMNCHKAWELTRGEGTTVVVTDQGFHIKHPELVDHIKARKHFGPRSIDDRDQNFHGTDMSRILLSVAPEARIIPVRCSARSMEELPPQIAKSFDFAAEQKADVITASWSARFQDDETLQAAVQNAAASGVCVSWFHYPHSDPRILRSSFTYAWWEEEPRLGFADRFLTTDPPGFHPVEIGAGLSGTAPQAAGLAALVKSVNPKLSPAEVKQILFENSDSIGGALLIPDAYRIVQAAQKKATR